MIPRIQVGKGVTGAVRYALSEGRDHKNDNKPRTEPKGEQSRVLWMHGENLGFAITTQDDVDLARRLMEFHALNQASKTKPCVKDCVHISLAWHETEKPTKEQMIEAGNQALAALGMKDAMSVMFAHGDEPYAHLHIVASKIKWETGYAYDLERSKWKLSRWAEKYEREFSGFIITPNRVEANQLRDAIDKRDAAAVLELMVQKNSTFTAKQLERQLEKQFKTVLDRTQFAEKVLSQPGIARLSDKAGGPITRYSTRAILEAEAQVLWAAGQLAQADHHRVPFQMRRNVLVQTEFAKMTQEQGQAAFHTFGATGLSLIDGQAGTGKSLVFSATRQAYEARGYHVIGLAQYALVAEKMAADGFRHTSTIHGELFRLINGRTTWNDRTVLIVDEAAVVDTKLMAQLVVRASEAKAKLILVGDDRQLSSIDRGGMFAVLKREHGAAVLTKVWRQLKDDDSRASELMAEGNFDTALRMYDAKGAIHWVGSENDAREALVEKWAKDSAADPHRTRFVFAYTNKDVDWYNVALREVRRGRGELDPKEHSFDTKHGRFAFSGNDRIQITGTDRKLGISNGHTGTIVSIESDQIAVRLDHAPAVLKTFNAKEFLDFRHGYAGTIHKGQGATIDHPYVDHSHHWRSASAYVANTRHKHELDIFVARTTAADVTELAKQMARVDERRAASHFYLHGKAIELRPVNSNELPKIELPEKEQTTNSPLTWTDHGGMVAHMGSALRAARDANPGLPVRNDVIGSADLTRPVALKPEEKPSLPIVSVTKPGTVIYAAQGPISREDQKQVPAAKVPSKLPDLAPTTADFAVSAKQATTPQDRAPASSLSAHPAKPVQTPQQPVQSVRASQPATGRPMAPVEPAKPSQPVPDNRQSVASAPASLPPSQQPAAPTTPPGPPVRPAAALPPIEVTARSVPVTFGSLSPPLPPTTPNDPVQKQTNDIANTVPQQRPANQPGKPSDDQILRQIYGVKKPGAVNEPRKPSDDHILRQIYAAKKPESLTKPAGQVAADIPHASGGDLDPTRSNRPGHKRSR